MDLNDYIAISNSKNPGTFYSKDKQCRICDKGIAKDNTPSHLYYQKFCSQDCKDKYIYPQDY